MLTAPWFTDPSEDLNYPLRSLFQEYQGSISFENIHSIALTRFPDMDSHLLDVLINTDPMITIRDSYFHYNWPGMHSAKEILNMIVADLDDEDSIVTVWDRHHQSLSSFDLMNLCEFQSFLAFRYDLQIKGHIDANVLQSFLESIDADSDDPSLSSILTYLDSTHGFSSFEDIRTHYSINDAEADSIRSSMDSCSRIINIGDYYKSDHKRNAKSLLLFRWPRDSKLFLPVFFEDNKDAFERLGYHSDYELIVDLKSLFPGSISYICIFDTEEICRIHDDHIRGIIKSRVNQPMASESMCCSNPFEEIVSEHRGSYFPLSDALNMNTGMSYDAVVHALYRFPNTYIEGKEIVWVYDVDTLRLSEILSDYSDGGNYGIKDVSNDPRLLGLNIVTSWSLISLMMRHFPEITDPLSGMIDFIPFRNADEVYSESHSTHQDTDGGFSTNDLAVYDAIERSGNGKLFNIRKELPEMSSEDLNASIHNLIEGGCVKRGSLGLICIQERRPSLSIDGKEGAGSRVSNSHPMVQYSHHSPESRLLSLQSFERLMSEVIEESVGYNPSSLIPECLSNVKGGRISEAIRAIIHEQDDVDKTISRLRESELNQVIEFCENIIDETDRMLFSKFDIPSNLFMFLFNRSREYYNALSFVTERGTGSPQNMLIEIMNNGLMVHRSESSDCLMDVRVRYFTIFDSLNSRCWLLEKSDEIDAIMYTLFMFNEYVLQRYELVNLCRLLIGHDSNVDSVVNGPLWSSIPDFVRITPKIAEFHAFDTIMGINDLLFSTTDYAYEIGKYIKSNREKLIVHGLFDIDSLPWFIDNLGLVSLTDGFIIGHGDLHDSLSRFVEKNQLFEPDLVLDRYVRKFGGDRDVLKPIVTEICSNIQKQGHIDESVLILLNDVFSQYQWVTLVNARSLVEDRCDLKGIFNASLMHTLGFNAQADVFYRTEYKNFLECLRNNEFSGDDLYLDNSLRVKMECNEFSKTIQYFVNNLMWIRVSDCRYINLRSERFAYLYDVLKKYREFAYKSCKGRFITPYSFSKMDSGFPDIDEDDFGLEFYEDVLLASSSRVSSIGGNRIFYNPLDSEYNCTAPDFIKYIIANYYNGKAAISEVQETLEIEYGIRIRRPIVRQFASSSCTLVRDLDEAYSSKERFLEDVQGVQYEESARNGGCRSNRQIQNSRHR